MADNFYRNTTNQAIVLNGSVANAFYLLDRTGGGEVHLTQPNNMVSENYNGMIFDLPDDSTAQPGYEFLPVTGGTVAVTHNMTNNILLPSKGGSGSSSLDGCTNALPPSGNNETANLVHNTWVGWAPNNGAYADFSMLTVDESGACQAPVWNQLLSTLMWANGGGYYKTLPVQTGTLSTNVLTTADYNVSDSSARLQATDSACTGCTNQGNGYAAKWTATPGTHDFSALPYFADTTRNVATFDTAYLHNAAGAQWVTGTGYTVGQIVSDPKAGVYANATVNYICTVAHTSGSTTEPNVGASWRSDWQFASLTDIAAATGAGTVITDGAIGCAAGCSMIQTLEGWVKRGFTPQNPALWCSGHDGEAVGAVPFCANGRLTLGMLGSIAGM
jgi:hypothetical protein